MMLCIGLLIGTCVGILLTWMFVYFNSCGDWAELHTGYDEDAEEEELWL